jgi:hypothetical protein
MGNVQLKAHGGGGEGNPYFSLKNISVVKKKQRNKDVERLQIRVG